MKGFVKNFTRHSAKLCYYNLRFCSIWVWLNDFTVYQKANESDDWCTFEKITWKWNNGRLLPWVLILYCVKVTWDFEVKMWNLFQCIDNFMTWFLSLNGRLFIIHNFLYALCPKWKIMTWTMPPMVNIPPNIKNSHNPIEMFYKLFIKYCSDLPS